MHALSGVHQPFDRTLKQITAHAARGLMELAGALPPGSEVVLHPIEREIAGPALRADQLFRYTDGGEWVAHFEFESRLTAVMPGRIVRYQKVIRLEYPDVEVNSVVFVLRPGGCPEAGAYQHREGRISPVVEVRYQLVRVWELDAADLLQRGDPALLPIAVLMKTTHDQLHEIARRVAGDPKGAGQFAALAALRYDKGQIEQILGGHPMIPKSILKESWLVQEVMEESRLEGERKGEQKWRTEEARTLLRRSLANRFPGLETIPELDRISDAATLENLLLDHMLGGSSREVTAEAIRAAAR